MSVRSSQLQPETPHPVAPPDPTMPLVKRALVLQHVAMEGPERIADIC